MDPLKRKQVLKWLTLAALFGLAQWFFGNLYEAVVISPNWVVDSPAQLRRLNEFFVKTSPTLYFVPLTLIAAVLVWVLTALNREQSARRAYMTASVFSALAVALNIFIVSTLITKLFSESYAAYGDALHTYAARWNLLNAIRMALVGAAAVYLFGAFRQLDRA